MVASIVIIDMVDNGHYSGVEWSGNFTKTWIMMVDNGLKLLWFLVKPWFIF